MSTQYTKIIEDVELNITPIYTDLMKASTGRGSAYIKAKETILDYVEKNNLTEIEKATLVSKTITDLASKVTTEAMQIAYSIAKENRDAPYTLTKLKEDTRHVTASIAKLEQDTVNAGKSEEASAMAIKKAQAELYRDYGVTSTSLDPTNTGVVGFTDYGSKHEAITMAKADIYNKYASSFRQNGVVTPEVLPSGYLGTNTLGTNYGLVSQQYNVAVRQESAFDDNMRQHAANSSASMISMLLSSDTTIDTSNYLTSWATSLAYLNTTHDTTSGAIDITTATLSAANGLSVSGTTTNINGGKLVTGVLTRVDDKVVMEKDIDVLVQLDGSYTFSNKSISSIAENTDYKLVLNVEDATHNVRQDTITITADA